MINISIVNFSAVFKDVDLPGLAGALQVQIARDFVPAWGIYARIYYTPSGRHPPPDYWVIGLFDDADVANAEGYHETTPTGQPVAKVFVKTTIADGGLVSVTASHELLECLSDPEINLSAEVDDASGNPTKLFSYENCDAVESLQYEIEVPAGWPAAGEKVLVSDFVYPSWFRSGGSAPFDFMGKVTAPFQLLPGGYIGFLDMGNLSAGWQQKTAKESMTSRARVAARPHVGSRRQRRALPRKEWIRSTYTPGSEAILADGGLPSLAVAGATATGGELTFCPDHLAGRAVPMSHQEHLLWKIYFTGLDTNHKLDALIKGSNVDPKDIEALTEKLKASQEALQKAIDAQPPSA